MRNKEILLLLTLLNVGGVLLNLFCGSLHIPASDVWAILTGGVPSGDLQPSPAVFIVLDSRLPAALTALLTGAALGASGLLLQSYFRNPLAGPSVLGITSGANLMVAIATLCGIGSLSAIGFQMTTTLAALVGASAVLAMLLALGRIVRQPVTLLILGMLLSYLTSAIITLLSYEATGEGLQQLMLWGVGTFGNVGRSLLPLYAVLILLGLGISALLIKPLNGWMLGEAYAQNAGIDLGHARWMVLAATGLLCAVTTAYCGPIAFIGLAMPHIARLLLRTDDHRLLLPASTLLGALSCSLCLWASTLPDGGHTLPINALTPILGIPVIVYVILKKR